MYVYINQESCIHITNKPQMDEVPTGRRREKGLDIEGDGVAGAGGGNNDKEAGKEGGGEGGKAREGGEGVDLTLGRIGERTVNVVARLRESDRFKNQMVRG